VIDFPHIHYEGDRPYVVCSIAAPAFTLAPMTTEVLLTPSSHSDAVSPRIEATITELRNLHKVLLSEDLDARVLTDFRDALNRIRNTAWAAQQSINAKLSDVPTSDVHSLLASERVRAAYQLCRAIQEDLKDDEVQYQKGQLTELDHVATELRNELEKKLSDPV
jgi:hypothetical protein